jgi:elongation factor G
VAHAPSTGVPNMQEYATGDIRNVALVGHAGVGKTTLAEAMLRLAGATTRAGSVADGTTVLDREPEEIERGGSISLGVASFEWKSSEGRRCRINLLDTPGHPDFEAEVDAALAVADLAIIVVSAIEGVEVGTELAWRKCAARGLPRFMFVTREDQSRANFENVVAQLGAAFGSGFAEIELPIGEQEAFHGVADVLTEQAHAYLPDGRHQVAAIPDELAAHEHEVHEHTVEEIVAGDDDQLQRYLDGEELTGAELRRTLAGEVCRCIEFPVLVGSGSSSIGVDRLLDYVCEIGPSPADREIAVAAGDRTVTIAADPASAPVAYVFKTVSDAYVGQVSLFRVITGTLRPERTLRDAATGADLRVHGLARLMGANQTPVTQLVAGDIGAATKLDAHTGTTLAPPDQPVRVPPVALPPAHVAVALIPDRQSDDDKLPAALQRLVREDPSLVVGFDELSRRTTLRGLGDTHIAVAIARLARKYGVKVSTGPVAVPYRRTIGSRVEVEGRLKKQSGGHGQFAVVDLVVAPLPRGAGFEFVDAIVGGAIPKNYVAAVHNGIEEVMTTGGHAGIPVVDVRVECVDGKTHSVDSSDMAFKTAASLGFQAALERGGSVLLEPISSVTVRVPIALQGDVLADLSSRRGRIVTSTAEDGEQIITAHVPTAELDRYTMDLRALTGGRATFDAAHDHYDVCPDNVATAVVKERATV